MSTPEFVRSPDSSFADLVDYPFAPNYLDIDGLRMHYIDEGPRDAPVVLMMHGMPSWSYLYRYIIPVMLEAGYRCVAPDHIGFGKSDKVVDPAWYNIARHTANTAALIQHLDLNNVTIMVQDWGGPTGLAQVANMPERFSRVCIMNTVNETSSLSPFLIQSAIAMNRTCVGANGKRTKQFRQQTEQKRTKQCVFSCGGGTVLGSKVGTVLVARTQGPDLVKRNGK